MNNWDIEDEDDLRFYYQVQRELVEKTCKRCGKLVRIRPDYAICDSCADAIADAIERGYDY